MKPNTPKKFETAIKEIAIMDCRSNEMTMEVVDQAVEDMGVEITAPFIHCHWEGLPCTMFSYN